MVAFSHIAIALYFRMRILGATLLVHFYTYLWISL